MPPHPLLINSYKLVVGGLSGGLPMPRQKRYGGDSGHRYSGIYIITNLRTGKSYVGQSGNVYRRRKQHFSALKSGKHENWRMQFEFNRYGRRNFRWRVLEWCPPNQLNEREKYWITRLNTRTPKGFNLTWAPYLREDNYLHQTAKQHALAKKAASTASSSSAAKKPRRRRYHRSQPSDATPLLERLLEGEQK